MSLSYTLFVEQHRQIKKKRVDLSMMEEKYDAVAVEEMFNMVMEDVSKAESDFEKTLGFKMLKYSEQKDAREIILKLGEWMFDYHLESVGTWSTRALDDVLISIFPMKIVAGKSFFEKVEPVLVKFFEYLYHAELQENGLVLAGRVKTVSVLMLHEVSVLLKDSDDEKLFELGEEMGLDMSDLSDLDRLYEFVRLFEDSEKKSPKVKIVSLMDERKRRINH